MTTNFRIADGTDLTSLFTAGSTGVSGFPFTFNAYVLGSYVPPTGFRRSDGTDISYLFQNIAVPLFTWSAISEAVYDYGVYDPPYNAGACNAGILYNTDGTTTLIRMNGGNSAGTRWGSVSPPSTKYVRCIASSGDTPWTGPIGTTWLALTSGRSWQLQANNGQPKSTILTMQFSDDASNVALTVYPELYAESTW